MKSLRWAIASLALIAITYAPVATGDDEVDPDRDFELPGAEVAEVGATGKDSTEYYFGIGEAF